MTDEQIIKALECCATDDGDDCSQCPYDNIVYEPGNGGCVNRCRKEALDLIKRQKAEIERLEIELKAMRGTANTYKKWYHEAKSEAIKEFAERLKEKFGISDCIVTIDSNDTDNLVKEMTEVQE